MGIIKNTLTNNESIFEGKSTQLFLTFLQLSYNAIFVHTDTASDILLILMAKIFSWEFCQVWCRDKALYLHTKISKNTRKHSTHVLNKR